MLEAIIIFACMGIIVIASMAGLGERIKVSLESCNFDSFGASLNDPRGSGDPPSEGNSK